MHVEYLGNGLHHLVVAQRELDGRLVCEAAHICQLKENPQKSLVKPDSHILHHHLFDALV